MTDNPTPARSPLWQAALALAAQGVPVFPCIVNGKDPACAHGFHAATTDVDQIDAWWSEADYNVAYEPERAGWCVVDVDGMEGLAAWDLACQEHGAAPETMVVRTPGGGLHLYFEGSLPSTQHKLGHKIDTRGHGGYVLAPPSYVIETKKNYRGPYRIERDLLPAPVPEWVVERAKHSTAEPRKAAEGVELDDPMCVAAAEGSIRADLAAFGAPDIDGDGRAFPFACRLKDLGISKELCVDMLHEQWAPHFDRDWLEFKVGNAYRYGQNEPGSDAFTSSPYDLEMQAAAAPPPKPAAPLPAYRDRPQVRLISGAGVRPRKVDWLWPGYLARGKYAALAGGKGAGKSTILYDLGARGTVGGKWPDGTPAPLGDFLVWSGEDDFEDTILPRFLVAGGDPARLYHVQDVVTGGEKRPFDPAYDIPGLVAVARQLPDLKMILIDPIVSAVAGDSHKNAETRRGLQPLVDLASECHAALVGITHFTKNTQGRDPIERITGSLAFGALARVALGAVKGEDEAAPRRFVRVASNIGNMGGGFEYLLRQEVVPGEDFTAQRVVWGKVLTGSAKELIEGVETQSARLGGVEFLERVLRDNGGMMMVKDLREAATANGHSWRTIERAKREMGSRIVVRQNQGAAHGGWRWDLVEPAAAANECPPDQW